MKYTDTIWLEMKPDVYGGKNFDEHVSMWNGQAAGDMGDDTSKDPAVFDPKDFPPGTKIVVSEPLCPSCGEAYGNCIVRGQPGDCGFDWKKWANEQYA